MDQILRFLRLDSNLTRISNNCCCCCFFSLSTSNFDMTYTRTYVSGWAESSSSRSSFISNHIRVKWQALLCCSKLTSVYILPSHKKRLLEFCLPHWTKCKTKFETVNGIEAIKLDRLEKKIPPKECDDLDESPDQTFLAPHPSNDKETWKQSSHKSGLSWNQKIAASSFTPSSRKRGKKSSKTWCWYQLISALPSVPYFVIKVDRQREGRREGGPAKGMMGFVVMASSSVRHHRSASPSTLNWTIWIKTWLDSMTWSIDCAEEKRLDDGRRVSSVSHLMDTSLLWILIFFLSFSIHGAS